MLEKFKEVLVIASIMVYTIIMLGATLLCMLLSLLLFVVLTVVFLKLMVLGTPYSFLALLVWGAIKLWSK